MSESASEDKRNEDVLHRYASNRLRVVPQLKYHPGRELAIDLGLFVNGLPVATVELKTDFTQSAECAREQYKNDRLPINPSTKRKHPLLAFKRGAVVHFAMSDSEIWMTTKLAGENLLSAVQQRLRRSWWQSSSGRWGISRHNILLGKDLQP